MFQINFSVVMVSYYHVYGYCIENLIFSVVDRHHFNLNHSDLDPDQTCRFDADSDPGLDSGLASK